MAKKQKNKENKSTIISNKSKNDGKKVVNAVVSDGQVDFLRYFVLIIAILLIAGLVFAWVVEFNYAGKVAYGLRLGEDDLGGMNRNQLEDYFDNKKELAVAGIELAGENLDEQTVFELGQMGIWVDIDNCQKQIWEYGKYDHNLTIIFNRIRALSGNKQIICRVDYDRIDYDNWLDSMRTKVNQPAVSASIKKEDNELILINAKEGSVMDENKLFDDLDHSLSVLDFPVIKLDQVEDLPAITDNMAIGTMEIARRELNNKMNWVYEDWVIEVDRDDIYAMLYFEQRKVVDVINRDLYEFESGGDLMYVGYNFSDIDNFLNNNAWMFEDKPLDARLAMTDDGPVVVQEGTTGKLVNRIKLIELLDAQMGQNKGEINLPVEIMESVISSDTIDELGIKELIATGSSDFSYSPYNRIHNITVGGDRFDGMVIAPGDEFSFTTLLGSVDAASGYLPELVIAGNETRPEYGGGLCQVSTTMYRTALDAGFPITARSPHQYRVSYYEPAGQDATVYIPNPDLRFINDTKNHILIETIISGSILTFNFYGTGDGRQVEVTVPVIYNITSPPAPEYIYTSGLPAGQKIQVDSAHYGADSIFYRYITYANGEKKEEEIFSRYQAWPAKYKVGEGEVEDIESNDQDVNLIDNNESGLPDVDNEQDLSGVGG